MLDTYVGGLGTFPKGHKLDLPPDIIERLPKDNYKKCPAPWDKHVDKQAVELTAAQNKVNDLRAKAERFQTEAEELKQRADLLVGGVAKKQADARKAEQVAKQEIARSEKAADNAKKAPSEQNTKSAADLKAKAWQLAREDERKDAEFHLAHSELSAALARGGLKRLDAEDTERRARAATKVLEQLKEKIARAKESNDAKSKTEQPADAVDGQIDESIDKPVDGEGARQVAEGQAVPSGQAGQ